MLRLLEYTMGVTKKYLKGERLLNKNPNAKKETQSQFEACRNGRKGLYGH